MADNPNSQSPSGQSPVDRSRRFRFVSRLVAFCLVTSGLFTLVVGLGGLAVGISLVEIYVKALLSLATAVSLAYIGGSVVDYNGGFANMFSRKTPSAVSRSDAYDDGTPKG